MPLPLRARRLAGAGTSKIGQITSDVLGNSVTQAKLGLGAFEGLANLVSLIRSDASPAEIAQHSIITIGTLAGTAIGAVFPIAGLVVSVFTSLIGGLIGSIIGGDSPEKQLYDLIMMQVRELILQNNLETQMRTVTNRLAAIRDELIWVPDVLEETPDATQISWMLTVQHSLELTWRDVFGDCAVNPSSDLCKSWQEAATVQVGITFTGLHLAIVSSMATMDTSSVRMAALLRERLDALGARYSPLLHSSYDNFKTFRLASIKTSHERSSFPRCGGPPGGSYSRRTGSCEDEYEGGVLFAYNECFNDIHPDNDQKSPAQFEAEAAQVCNTRRGSIEDQLENTFKKQIDALLCPFTPDCAVSLRIAQGPGITVVSASPCSTNDCASVATCPEGSWVKSCVSSPADSGDGIQVTPNSCSAYSGGSWIRAFAYCSTQQVSVTVASDALWLDSQVVSASCTSGDALACYCHSWWTSAVCGGTTAFLPSGPTCSKTIGASAGRRRGTQIGAGARIHALCVKPQ